MASRGLFNISGARGGARPAGPGRETPATGRGLSAVTRGSSGRRKVRDGLTLGERVYLGIPRRFPARKSCFVSRCSHPGQDLGRRCREGSAGPRERRAGVAAPWPSTTRTSSSAASRRASVSPGGRGWGQSLLPFPAAGPAGGARGPVTGRGARAALARREAEGRGGRRHSLVPLSFPLILLLFSFYFPFGSILRRPLRIQQHLGALFWLRDKSYLPGYPYNSGFITGFILGALESEIESRLKDLLHKIRI